jgi:hypothetical protein
VSIAKFLKKPEAELVLIQGRIDPDLYRRLMKRLKKDKVKVRLWLEAAAQAFLADDPAVKLAPLPFDEGAKVELLQGRIDRNLRDQLMHKLKLNNHSIRDWMTAAARSYLAE